MTIEERTITRNEWGDEIRSAQAHIQAVNIAVSRDLACVPVAILTAEEAAGRRPGGVLVWKDPVRGLYGTHHYGILSADESEDGSLRAYLYAGRYDIPNKLQAVVELLSRSRW